MIEIRFRFDFGWGLWTSADYDTLEEARIGWTGFFDRYPNKGGVSMYEFRERQHD